eukprot:1727978-Amphidinium_carterae.1
MHQEQALEDLLQICGVASAFCFACILSDENAAHFSPRTTTARFQSWVAKADINALPAGSSVDTFGLEASKCAWLCTSPA